MVNVEERTIGGKKIVHILGQSPTVTLCGKSIYTFSSFMDTPDAPATCATCIEVAKYNAARVCRNCRWHDRYSKCRKHAPILIPNPMDSDPNYHTPQFPPMGDSEWCGDWEIRTEDIDE